MSVVEPLAEEEYLGKMPTSFKMIAALLGDLEDSDGQGKVHFRWDSSPDVLSRAAEHVQQAFPRDDGVEPTTVFIVTWENMAARGTSGRGDGLNTKVRGYLGFLRSRQRMIRFISQVCGFTFALESDGYTVVREVFRS